MHFSLTCDRLLGGQPSDIGTIEGDGAVFKVVHVALNRETGHIVHSGDFEGDAR